MLSAFLRPQLDW